MNLYAVFAGDNYYPAGGADDLLAMFDAESDDEAVERTIAILPRVDWVQLVEIAPPEMRSIPLPPHREGQR